ncbi:Lipopolysaccharide export system permease protein LptF [Sphingomonas antarctica]|uniref:LPS export ABC transporter permease LptF n=1 Tax=Sphingomonas antarctica TaxID=2040274 RepID=UPI0039E96573
MLSATDRYIARQIIVPLVSSLVVAAMLLVLDRMLRLFDFVAQEGGPVSVVWKMLASLLPEYLSLGIPIGLLMGILLAFRKLALSTELDVLQAVGQGYPRLLRVPFLYAIVLAAVNLAIVGYVQPRARYAYEGLRYELRSGQLGASIKVGEFTRLGKNLTLRIERSAKEGRELTGMFVNVRRADGTDVSVTADRGTFLATDDPDTIILRLENGTLVQDDPKFAAPRVLAFSAHDLPIDLPRIGAFRAPGERDRELTLPQLVRSAKDGGVPELKRDKARANFHFRMVEVVVMLLLPLLGVALAVPPKRSTSALGVFLSIVMVVAYHKVNEYAEGVGGLGYVNPVLALWLPFALFTALILWMFYTLAFVPGGQPIGGLEVVFGKIAGVFKRWFGRWTGKAANA